MSKQDIQRQLQECIEGYDAGMTPEECLSAYPQARAELEPLLRQALSLRMAFVAMPREEFVEEAREKLLASAGRDVVQAFANDPDQRFVEATRRRLLNAAGAGAQEALRDVPPPRLPFWSNARRRLLETASTPQPPRRRAMGFGMRSAVSAAAVVVLAVGVAGAGFFLNSVPANDTPSAASAELADIQQDFAILQEQSSRGEIIPPSAVKELAERTAVLYERLDEDAPEMENLPELINKQQTFLNHAVEAGGSNPEYAAARENLTTTEQKVDETAALAASPDPIETVEAPTETPPPATATPPPTETPDVSPTAQPTTVPTTPVDLQPDQILIRLDPSEQTLGLDWLRVQTTTVDFLIESSWTHNYQVDEEGLAVLSSPFVIITPEPDNADPAVDRLIVSTDDGEVIALIDGEQVTLRSEGADGEVMTPAELVELAGNELSAALYHFLNSVEVLEATDDADATATPTPEPTEQPDGNEDEDGAGDTEETP